MRSTKLAAFLKIQPGEGRMVALVGLLFALIDASRGFGPNAVDALFFSRYGVDKLPLMYVGLGVFNFVITLVYTASLGRFERRTFFTGLVLVVAAALMLGRAAVMLSFPALYPALWLSVKMFSAILGTFMWHLAGDVVDARQAKRLFPLLTSASIAGSIVGNLITGPLAQSLGTDNLLLVYAGFMLVCAWLTRGITRDFYPEERVQKESAGFVENLKTGFETVRRSPLLRLLTVASVLFSVLYFSLSFLFSQAVAENIPDEAQIAGFLGLFTSIATGATLLVSLFVASRLYARIGLVNAVFILPVTYLFSFLLLALSFTLPSAITARLSQSVLLGGIASSAWNTFYNVVPPARRGQVRTFDFGVPAQLGTILSGVLLILGQTVLQRQQVFVIGLAVSALCAGIVWQMRRGYGEALLDALRAGRFEVFDGDERAFAAYRADTSALRVIEAALNDERPSTRRLATEMVIRTEARPALPAVVKRLADAAAEVRIGALRVMFTLGGPQYVADVLPLVDDPDPEVRSNALATLVMMGTAESDLLPVLQARLTDADHHVQVHAARAIMWIGRIEAALPVLYSLLDDDDWLVRRHALDGLAEAAGEVPLDVSRVAALASGDPARAVRRAACRTLSQSGGGQAVEALVVCLQDPDGTVRGAAAKGLRVAGAEGQARMMAILEGEDGRAQMAVLTALERRSSGLGDLREPLARFAQREIVHLREVREIESALAHGEQAPLRRLACDMLAARTRHSEERLVVTLGLLGDASTMQLVGKGLRSGDGETRAAALEALETLGDKDLVREAVPLLEQAPAQVDGGPERASALRRLLADADMWMRAVAVRVIGELGLDELAPDVRVLAGAEDLLLREAVAATLADLGLEERMETLQTMSTLERLLLLREVPLFADLSPDDLKQVADIAREELYHPGDALMREGEDGNEMYVLASGTVEVVKRDGDGEKVLAVRKAGDFIGEMAIIESEPRFATVRATGEARTLVIDAGAFDAILRDRPQVGRAMLRGLSRRLRESA